MIDLEQRENNVHFGQYSTAWKIWYLWCYRASYNKMLIKESDLSIYGVVLKSVARVKRGSHLLMVTLARRVVIMSLTVQKMAAVNDIFEKLRDKHNEKYSPEQLRAWSHLLEMEKHDSYEEPPDKPFFRGMKSSATNPSPGNKLTPVGISPGKKVNMRSELIDQLHKWYQLLETGGICQMQYTELPFRVTSKNCDYIQLVHHSDAHSFPLLLYSFFIHFEHFIHFIEYTYKFQQCLYIT